MKRPTVLVLICLSLFLAVFPLTLDKPGWPPGLKADEPAYYLMALSLAHDRDLRLEKKDVARLAQDFPLIPVRNLVLMTDDGWKTVYYGKPYIYSLFAAPFAFLEGADGMLCFNMLLMLSMVWLGFFYLRCYNPDWLAALAAAGFFLLSAGFAYVFWLQAEIFNMAAIAASLFLAFYPFADRHPRLRDPAGWRRLWVILVPVLSGAALSLAAYNKPMLAALALAPMVRLIHGRKWKDAALWVLGFVACGTLVAGLAVALTGHPSAYLGVQRAGVTVCSLDTMPTTALRDEALAVAREKAEGLKPPPPRRRSWEWIFRLPAVRPGWLLTNLGYFLWGRHTGLLLYLPFSLFAFVFFLWTDRRSWERWALFASLVVVALAFLVWIPFNWQGGGGFVGNRYFVSAYPAFLFLMSRLRPAKLLPLAYLVAGVLVGPIVFTPLGDVVPEGTLQAHVRNFPFPHFPLELSLKNIPGYDTVAHGEARFEGRKDEFLPHGDQMWLRGASSVEVWISTTRPMAQLAFEVTDLASPNVIDVSLGGAHQRLVFHQVPESGQGARVILRPGSPDKVRSLEGGKLYYYRLVVTPSNGKIEPYTKYYPPPICPNFGYNRSENDSFFVGAELTFLGEGKNLGADVYELEWRSCRAPEEVEAGQKFAAEIDVINRSAVTWSPGSGAAVKLSYHWLDATGHAVIFDGLRTLLPHPVPPGGELRTSQQVEAPSTSGAYTLELDPVFEYVSWFSAKNGGKTCRASVRVH
ncbi:MAG TPA: hypothetical protein VKA53_02050 [Thermoanaerobaculia bacterium]|nr:hypothetical protein [Thermoanaerobaculia bacterium]